VYVACKPFRFHRPPDFDAPTPEKKSDAVAYFVLTKDAGTVPKNALLVDADWGQALGSGWGADASKVRCLRHVPGNDLGAPGAMLAIG